MNKNNKENVEKCPICGIDSTFDLNKFPPKKDRKNEAILTPYKCYNGHEFNLATPIKKNNDGTFWK